MNTVRREGNTPQATPFLPPSAGTAVMAAVRLAMAHDERLVGCAKSTRMVGKELFEHAYVALTDQRLLIFASDDGVGVGLAAADALGACRLINHRELADGSMLMVVGHRGGFRCLYFEPFWRAEAERILEAVGHQTPPQKQLRSLAAASDVDRFELSQEFAGILEGIDNPDD